MIQCVHGNGQITSESLKPSFLASQITLSTLGLRLAATAEAVGPTPITLAEPQSLPIHPLLEAAVFLNLNLLFIFRGQLGPRFSWQTLLINHRRMRRLGKQGLHRIDQRGPFASHFR